MKCRDCGSQAVFGKCLCEKHAEMKRKRQKEKRERRRALGLCIGCGKPKENNSVTKCNSCVELSRFIRNRERGELKQNKKCIKCRHSKDIIPGWNNSYRLCPLCFLKEKFDFAGSRTDAELIISSIIKKQNYRCVLSGRSLIHNKYHIDHIVPKSIAPELENDLNNWQIIVAEANYFKNNKTDDSLLSICKDIVSWHVKNGKLDISYISNYEPESLDFSAIKKYEFDLIIDMIVDQINYYFKDTLEDAKEIMEKSFFDIEKTKKEIADHKEWVRLQKKLEKKVKRFDPDDISDELLLEELKKLADRLGRAPSQNDINRFGNNVTRRVYLYRRRFGSLQDAQERIGLNRNLGGSELKYSDDELLNEIIKVKLILNGKMPSQSQIEKYGKYPIGAYKRHFGRYSKAVCLANGL